MESNSTEKNERSQPNLFVLEEAEEAEVDAAESSSPDDPFTSRVDSSFRSISIEDDESDLELNDSFVVADDCYE